jgi:uncharacterized protein
MVNASALYECSVMHKRLTPLVHQFSYRVFYLWLDLDEIDALSQRLRFFSRNAFNIYSFFDADHLDKTEGTVKSRLLAWIAAHGEDISRIASVRFLTFPRIFGYIFNPASFYYCFDADGQPLHAVVQVTNTFHEQKPYFLRQPDGKGEFCLITPKHFYVSPFSELEMNFDFKIRVPGEKLQIHIDDRAGDQRILLSAVTGIRKPLTDARLFWFVLKYPLLTLRVIFLIHWHAFLLWVKKVPFHRKSAQPELQSDLYRPHRSIASTKTP